MCLLKPCFGSWHPGHRNCARCEDEDECYAAFDKVYGHAWLKNAKPKMDRKCAMEAGLK